MTPLLVEVSGSPWINRETLGVNECRKRSLGGNEAIQAKRLEDPLTPGEDEEEVYEISQVDYEFPQESNLQKVIIADAQPSAHFYIGDTLITAEYIPVS